MRSVREEAMNREPPLPLLYSALSEKSRIIPLFRPHFFLSSVSCQTLDMFQSPYVHGRMNEHRLPGSRSYDQP